MKTDAEMSRDAATEKTVVDADCREASGARCVVRSERNGRERNEDSFQIVRVFPAGVAQPLTLLGVADGMGGHEHGEMVSREALRKFSLTVFEQLSVEPSLNRAPEPEPFEVEVVTRVLMEALEAANEHVRLMVKQNGWGMAGSTISVAAVGGGTAVIAYLGDSPVFHFEGYSRRLRKVTQDHTVAGVLLRAGVINSEMARVHEGSSRLEFYLGAERLPGDRPVEEVVLEASDLLLLCSDGVGGLLRHEEIERLLSESNGDLESAADRLLAAAREAGETDNQTLILWRGDAGGA